jgi:hypothetical protein
MSTHFPDRLVRPPSERTGIWFSKLGRAIWSAALKTGIALIAGVSLTVWVSPSIANPKWSLVAEHLGLGFIVAGLSVFAYEYGAHMREVVDLSAVLARSIEERIAPIAQAVGRDALDRALRELFAGDDEIKPYVAEAISQCKELVTALSQLEKSGIWAHEQYVEFISYLLKFVLRDAQTLQSLGHPDKPSQYTYEMPTSSNASGVILALQMKALRPGDRYDVISDLTSWKDEQLRDFLKSTEKAIRDQGVEVVRIFNMRHAHSRRLERDKAKDILVGHLKYSKDLGLNKDNRPRYQVLVITEKELEEENSDEYKERIQQAHFGIFTRCADKLGLRVEVKMPDLSHMTLTNDREQVARDYSLFERALGIAKPLTEATEIDAVLDLAGLK